MNYFDKDKIHLMIESFVNEKNQASIVLADYFKCETSEIFYKHIKGVLDEQGITDNGYSFFFHGYGCTVKNDDFGLNVELEFGPHGRCDSFDRFSLCHYLDTGIDSCDNLTKFLIQHKIIKLVDEALCIKSKNSSEIDNLVSEKEQIDVCVSDRYMLVDGE